MPSPFPHWQALPLALALTMVACAADNVVLFDFESEDALDGWANDGGAFFVASVSAPNHGKVKIEGAQGGRFLYSFDTEKISNHPVGTLVSPEFEIQRGYINFLLGGSRGWPEEMGAQLVVGGKVVRAATGRESLTGGAFRLMPLNWDVREFLGKKAQIVFNDKTPYGSVGADAFFMSDTPRGWRTDAATRWGEIYRPAFHASTGHGYSGDADGMFYYRGRWFLGYQWVYVGSGGYEWGQTVSKDLVRWTMRGPCVRTEDNGSMSTGGAAVDLNNTSGLRKDGHDPILLFYTHRPVGSSGIPPDAPLNKAPKTADKRLYPALAYSTDGGETYTKDPTPLFQYGNPEMLSYDPNNLYTLDGGKTWVNDPSPLLGSGQFNKDRDTGVFWHEPTQHWIMIWHLSQSNNRPKTAFGLYRSKDFKKWELFQTIPGLWECPDMFEMDAVDMQGKKTGKSYWVVNRGGVEYFIGTFDGKEFIPISANDPKNPYEFKRFQDTEYDQKRFLRRSVFKSGFYAAQTFSNAPEGRIVQVSWMNDAKSAPNFPGCPWENLLSFPAEVTLRDTGNGLVLEHTPVKEIQSIYTQTHTRENITLNEGVTDDLVPLTSNLLDIEVVFSTDHARAFGLSILGEKIKYEPKKNRLDAFRYRDNANNLKDAFAIIPPRDGKISLRILVDRSSIELGVLNGLHRAGTFVYPQTDAQLKLEFFSEGGNAKIEKLAVHEIECEQASANP